MKIKKLGISYEFFSDFFKKREYHFKVIANPLPNDSKIIRMSEDIERNTVWLLIQSEKFKDINEAEMIPILDPPVFEEIGGKK